MSEVKEAAKERCVVCNVLTDRWVRGWDDKYRCIDDAPKGPRATRPANHCPTCTCEVRK
jgi:hypothetical protein